MTDLTLSGLGGPFTASVHVPGDKSLSHRALFFAAVAQGDSLITGLGPGEDIQATATALGVLGVSVSGQQIRSPGIQHWTTPDKPIDCGNSGTTLRLLAGLLSTSKVEATLIGDSSLSHRPMGRLIEPLRALGGSIGTSNTATPPLTVGGIREAGSANVTIDIASAQVRTAFELAALPRRSTPHRVSAITRSGGSALLAGVSGRPTHGSESSRAPSRLRNTGYQAIRRPQPSCGHVLRSNRVPR